VAGAAGLEPADPVTPGSSQVGVGNGGCSDRTETAPPPLTAQLAAPASRDADLVEVLAAWTTLAAPIRAGILALVRAARDGSC